MEPRSTSLKGKKNEEEIPLSIIHDMIEVKGPMTYNESAQAWNIIRLRKEVLHEFPDLKDKRTTFGYKLVIPRNAEAIKKLTVKSLESPNVLPIFLTFSKLRPEDK